MPCAALGVALLLCLLVLTAVVVVVVTPSLRTSVMQRAVVEANSRTDWDIDLGRLYLSPFHHSPKVLYRAWRGDADLPLQVEVDSLYVGHRGQDTLLYVHALRLRALVQTAALADMDNRSRLAALTRLPIEVEALQVERTTFHSDSMIAAVGVDAQIGRLDVSSPGLSLAEGKYPLRGLKVDGMYVGIDLRPDTATAESDSSSTAMAFDVTESELRNMRFMLTPVGLDVRAGYLSPDVLADVGGSLYDARSLKAGNLSVDIGSLHLPFDTLYGQARVDLNSGMITSRGLHARSNELDAQADLTATALDLESMRVDVEGDAAFRGSQTALRGYYDIDDQTYDMRLNVERSDLSPLLKQPKRIIVAGDLQAEGKGIDIDSRATRSKIQMHLTEAVYDNISAPGLRLDATLANRTVAGTLHLPVTMQDSALQVSAQTDNRFSVAEFMSPKQMRVDLRSHMRNIRAHAAGEDFAIDTLQLDFATDTATVLDLTTAGLHIDANSPMHVLTLLDSLQPLLNAVGDTAILRPLTSLQDLTMIDTLRHLVPELAANITLTKGSPVQHIIERAGLDVDKIDLSVASDPEQTNLALDASIPTIEHPDDSAAMRLPAAKAAMRVMMSEGRTTASLTADSKITDGVMGVHDLQTDAALRMDLERNERELSGDGRLTLDRLKYGGNDLGTRTADIHISPSKQYANALKADVRVDDIELELVDSIIQLKDIRLDGAVRARATADGLPDKLDLSAEVLPIGISATHTGYGVELGLGETPVIMEHNHVDLNGLRIYGADSTFVALTGDFNLDDRRLNVVLTADSFAPAKLVKDGPIPIYGDLATDISGTVTGPLDSIMADVDVTILPTTDLTYPIDKKNLAQVKPHGTVNVRYNVAESAMNLGGQLNVDDGVIKYSPSLYPIMPFRVDPGSKVMFNGPLGQSMLDVSASQDVKATVQSEGEESRRVDFTTGVRVQGPLDSLGLNALNFFLEAPKDEVITRELESVDEDTREGLAATLLATGMYAGQSNAAAQESGHALSSIINSRINAAMANSKLGKVIDLDISSGKHNHGGAQSNDMSVSLSKSLFNDRLRITAGATISDNPDASNATGLYYNVSADYSLTKDGNVQLRLFSQRDYNNIFEGELYKSGLGVRATQEWKRTSGGIGQLTSDSITRTFGLTADANVAYRSNNSLGPDLSLTSSVKNLLGRNEVLSVKGDGAYYWGLRDRDPKDPKRTDTYKLGARAALIFPYLHWAGDDNPDGSTRYMLGYQYENIAGGYGVHKVSGSFTYFIRSSEYITHSFTPFSLSVVMVNAESDELIKKAAENPQLYKVLASNEFVPSVAYNFTYNDYRSRRAVNTMLDLGVKEAGNLVNAVFCAFGHSWNEKEKKIGNRTFDQFVKVHAELRNKFNFTEDVCIATRLYAGANIPIGNSDFAPLSEAFYTGGSYSLRAASPYAYGPGNYNSLKYNHSFFHAGDVKLEGNIELRFPIVWKLYGAFFVDAGNVWALRNSMDMLSKEEREAYLEQIEMYTDLYDGLLGNPYLAKQIALGTGTGLRLDFEGLVLRLDIGVGIHSPYQTYRYNKKDWTIDYTQPIKTYYNMPSALDALRINFGVGYPF